MTEKRERRAGSQAPGTPSPGHTPGSRAYNVLWRAHSAVEGPEDEAQLTRPHSLTLFHTLKPGFPLPELPRGPCQGTEVKGGLHPQCLPSSTVTLGVQAPPPPDPMYLTPRNSAPPHPETLSLEGQAYLQITHLEASIGAAPAHPGSRRVTNLLPSPGSIPWSCLLLSHSNSCRDL